MLLPFIPEFRRRRGRPKRIAPQPVPPGPVALTLVQAVMNDQTSMQLAFDRAININALDPYAFTLKDQSTGMVLGGAWGELLEADRLVLYMEQLEPYTGSGVLLSATGATRIVAVDDGGRWQGVTDLEIPWPE